MAISAGTDKCQKAMEESFKCMSGIRTVARLKISGSIGKDYRSQGPRTTGRRINEEIAMIEAGLERPIIATRAA
jgi:hypothetical protein